MSSRILLRYALWEVEGDGLKARGRLETAESANVFPVLPGEEPMHLSRWVPGQCDEHGKPLADVRVGGKKIRRSGMAFRPVLHDPVEGYHGRRVKAGGLHHAKPFDIGFPLMGAVIVQ